MSAIRNAKNAILMEMSGLSEVMSSHARNVVACLALSVAVAAPAHSAELSGSELLGVGLGAAAGNYVAPMVGANKTVLTIIGGIAGGKLAGYEKKPDTTSVVARQTNGELPAKTVAKLDSMRTGVEAALEGVRGETAGAEELELEASLSPDDAKARGQYASAVNHQRYGWNEYTRKRSAYANAVAVAERQGFDVSAYKKSLKQLSKDEAPVYESIRARSESLDNPNKYGGGYMSPNG